MQQFFLSVKLPSEDTRLGCGVALHGSLIFNVQIKVMYLIHDTEGAAVAQWLRCWTLNCLLLCSRRFRFPLINNGFCTVIFRSLGNFVYPTLPQSTQLQMSTNTVWKEPAMN